MKHIYTLAYFLATVLSIHAQTFTSNPAVQSWKTYSTTQSPCNTFNPGGDNAIKARITNVNSSTISFEQSKNSGSNSYGGGEYIVRETLCGSNLAWGSTQGGTSVTSLYSQISNTIAPGQSKSYYVIFYSWSNSFRYYQGPFTITRSSNNPSQYSVTINNIPSNTQGYTTGQGQYSPGTFVTVNAYPSSNDPFSHWEDVNANILSTNSGYTFVINTNVTLRARFQSGINLTGSINSITPSATAWVHGNPASITSSITSDGKWSGKVRLAWYEFKSGQYTYVTDLENRTVQLQPNQPYSLSFNSASIQSSANDYQVRLEYENPATSTYQSLTSQDITVLCSSLQVPHSQQTTNTRCGQNCVVMCLNYFSTNRLFSENDVCVAMNNWDYSTAVQQASAFNKLTNSNYRATAKAFFTLPEIKKELCEGRPVIVWVREKMSTNLIEHAMVAINIDNSNIYVHDPLYNSMVGMNNKYPIQQFMNSWYSNGNLSYNNVVYFESTVGGGVHIQETLIKRIRIYPNSSNGIVNIELPLEGDFELSIFNMMGQNVYTEMLNKTSSQIRLRDLPSGLYKALVKVHSSDIVFQETINLIN